MDTSSVIVTVTIKFDAVTIKLGTLLTVPVGPVHVRAIWKGPDSPSIMRKCFFHSTSSHPMSRVDVYLARGRMFGTCSFMSCRKNIEKRWWRTRLTRGRSDVTAFSTSLAPGSASAGGIVSRCRASETLKVFETGAVSRREVSRSRSTRMV